FSGSTGTGSASSAVSTGSTGSASSGGGAASAATESTASGAICSSSAAGAMATGARSIMIATGAPGSAGAAGGSFITHHAAPAWATMASAAALVQRMICPTDDRANCRDQAMSDRWLMAGQVLLKRQVQQGPPARPAQS